MSPETALGYLTGLRWLAPQPLDLPSVIATGLVVNVCDGLVCRLCARNNGYSPGLWTVLGFIFGLWAVAVCVLLPKRTSR